MIGAQTSAAISRRVQRCARHIRCLNRNHHPCLFSLSFIMAPFGLSIGGEKTKVFEVRLDFGLVVVLEEFGVDGFL